MSLIDFPAQRNFHPVDLIEDIAGLHDWTFERADDDEITISTTGSWSDYHISFSWLSDLEALHLSCAFDIKVTGARRNEIMKLLALVNEQMWLGHFDLWGQEGVVIFRESLFLAGGAKITSEQIEGLLSNAVEACERYYPAFQYVVWAGKDAQEALDFVAFETAGEA